MFVKKGMYVKKALSQFLIDLRTYINLKRKKRDDTLNKKRHKASYFKNCEM